MCAIKQLDWITGLRMDGEIEQLQSDLKTACHPFFVFGVEMCRWAAGHVVLIL